MATVVQTLLRVFPRPPALRRAQLIKLAFIFMLALSVTFVLTGGGSTAMAQQTTTQFADGLATPQGGLVLSGTAINPATGNPFRHLWTADAVNGLCRLDPDVDTVASHAINPATCLNTVAGAAFNASQLTLDPATNTIYAVDGGGKAGIFVLNFLPGGDSGHGLVDQVNQSVLGPTCGIAVSQPTATSLGPDGNLYVGFKRSGNVMRIISPLSNPLPCATNVQSIVITTGDKLTSQMAWLGHTLLLNDSRVSVQVDSADQCLTPQNPTVCSAIASIVIAPIPTTVVSDQTPGQLNGDDAYFASLGSVSAMTGVTLNALGEANLTAPQPFGGTGANFANISALALDASDPTNNVLYVGDDLTGGAVAGTGRWFQVLSVAPPPGPPSAPLNVIATAGNASASLSWAAPGNHQPVTSYTVHDSFASNGAPVADLTLTAPVGSTIVPTGANITGLVNGVTYQFEVQASNAQGSSPFSNPSNSVTPQAPTVPGAPTNVAATAGNASASVTWVAPVNNGGSAITSYTVSAFTGGAPTGIVATVGAQNTATVFGLTNGVAYTFSVHATNAVGNGPESAQSAPVTPGAQAVPAVTVSMTGTPSPVISNGSVVYTVAVANSGTITAPAVTVTDTAFSATVSSVVTTQGACTISGTGINCNLGDIAVGNAVNITVTLKPANGVSQMQNGATATPAGGASSSALVTTPVIPLSQTTDLQVTGAAQNGAPLSTGTDTFTWQIKNAQTVAANTVIFTSHLAPNMVFQSATATLGAVCTTPDATNTFTCSLPTLNGGQTMVVTVVVGFNASGSMATTGRVDFTGMDNNPNNNSASITIGVK